MKKNILTFLSLSFVTLVNAQSNTYVNGGAFVTIKENTLFYNSGDFFINTKATNTIVNKGNVYTGGFKKGSNVSDELDGTQFVNVWTEGQNANTSPYGQLIIFGTDNNAVTARMTQQKKSVASSSVDWYPIGLPFQGAVTELMNAFEGKTASDFVGDCQVNVHCGGRYRQTLMIWDNPQIENDAVHNSHQLKPGYYYLLNLEKDQYSAGLNSFYDGNKIIPYKGKPAPAAVTISTGQGTPRGINADVFAGMNYSQWMNNINYYRETYKSYLGERSNPGTLYRFGKNMYRFANPFTSNVDLSDPSKWLTIGGSSTSNINNGYYVLKANDAFEQSWTAEDGSTVAAGKTIYVRAKRENGIWVGNEEALLLRPLEMFRVTVTNRVGNTTPIVPVTVNLGNDVKTFKHKLDLNLGSAPRGNNAENFYQMEVGIYNTARERVGSPIFLSTSSVFESGNDLESSDLNLIYFVEEEKDGTPVANSRTLVNTFKDDYIRKPIEMKFSGVKIGQQYILKFRLKEYSIFTSPVQKFDGDAKFYLYDKVEKVAHEITSDFELPITIASALETNNRYEFYWKDYPKGNLGNNDLSVDAYKTIVYKASENDYRVKFDQSKQEGVVEIFALDGQKVSTQKVKSVNKDLKLNLPVAYKGLYIIKTSYNDGSVVSQKLLVD
ncbi:T9SS type A sorting domain-containing protein [Vaginella massiliensis]|uniref:T9SS type A sorting domain-containing protein n=1 Tax=Vaginella massiliensis TaxID=1816680 RepID=UPI0008381CD8|nr:T9SS type A sorting domain-containing protein [Vaginella massiliensis]